MAEILSPDITGLPLKEIDFGTALFIVYVIVVAYILVRIVPALLRRLADRPGERRLSVTMLIPLVKIVVYIAVIILILQALVEPSLSQVVAFAGFFGAGLGFGLKDVFADIVGGLVISFERPYQIGDKISIQGNYGEVVDIGLRSTRIVTPDDSLVSIPNYVIFSEATSSSNAGKAEMMVVVDVYIDHRSDAVAAMAILKDAVRTSKYVYISPSRPYTVLLEDFPFYKRVRAKAYASDLRYEFEFSSEVTRRAWTEMKRQGIAPPEVYPAELGTREQE
ncbi:mechanosensitive ion channel protein MscS [Methanoculleus taiwanensis]|uniref:Mechanosensitive ion channel protein MscS n=1 Tax=Methanoculleus taiwanensis TaxID=1550565 RepID=A0A498GWT0_9EURY|nr:mechanosensitive ion channel domain-containing protein [Methanoculleus taiwanensis]RXE55309.1 mechanosensitive ion channel protein MscS [Methanoculleus taiwanensis]